MMFEWDARDVRAEDETSAARMAPVDQPLRLGASSRAKVPRGHVYARD